VSRSFLLFLKRLDEREHDAERAAKLRGKKHICTLRMAMGY